MCYGYRRTGANYLRVRRIFGRAIVENKKMPCRVAYVLLLLNNMNLRLRLTLSDCP